MLGLASHHRPTSYCDIIGRDPQKVCRQSGTSRGAARQRPACRQADQLLPKSRTQPRFGFDRLALDINLGQRDEPSTSRVPADHLLRKIDGVLDLSELRHELAPFYR